MTDNEDITISRRRALGIAMAGSAVLAAPRIGHAQTADRKLVVLTGTKPPDPITHLLYYAREIGAYRKQGLDVEIRELAGEPLALRALLAGQGDIVLSGTPQALAAMNGGAKIRAISAFFSKPDYVVVGDKSISRMSALSGRTVGVSQVGAVSQLIPFVMVKQDGGDPRAVRWVPAGGSINRLQALAAKKLDAVPLNSSFVPRALGYDHVHVIGDAMQQLPDFLYGVELTTTDTWQQKRAELLAWTRALSDAAQWFYSHPDEAVKISQSLLPDVPPAEIDQGIRAFGTKRFFGTEPDVSRAKWDFTTKALLDAGAIDRIPDFDQYVVALNKA